MLCFYPMQRFWLLILFCVFGPAISAQTDFCVPGATWVYYTPGGAAWITEETFVTYAGDTTIAGFQNVKRLNTQSWSQIYQGFPITYGSWNSFIRQTNDSVFHWVGGSWELIFDFSAEVGDTRVVYIEGGACTAHDTMLIESIDTVSFQGMDLRRTNYRILLEDQLDALQLQHWGTLQHRYLERVGIMFDSPIGSTIHCSGAVSEYMARNLTCYTDTEILNNGGEACHLVLSDQKTSESDNRRLMYSLGTLTIQNAQNSKLYVYNTLGKELLLVTVNSDDQSIDLSHLPKGILLAVCESEKYRITKKVVKTSN